MFLNFFFFFFIFSITCSDSLHGSYKLIQKREKIFVYREVKKNMVKKFYYYSNCLQRVMEIFLKVMYMHIYPEILTNFCEE